MSIFKELFEKITERYTVPIKLSKTCEVSTFYRVEDLTAEDIDYCAQYLTTRVLDSFEPEILLEMPGSTSNLARSLASHLSEYITEPKTISLSEFSTGNGAASLVKGKKVAIINDVITTGRSCLEAHSNLTLNGANVVCWVALIDRTFGPGPVSVIATLTGDPVKLLD